jgi:hypothetical protein
MIAWPIMKKTRFFTASDDADSDIFKNPRYDGVAKNWFRMNNKKSRGFGF